MSTTTMYRLADDRGMPLGVFDTLEEAKDLVPEADHWRAEASGLWNGWCPENVFGGRPDFTIQAVA